MAIKKTFTITGNGATAWVPLNYNDANFNVGILVDKAGENMAADVEVTHENVLRVLAVPTQIATLVASSITTTDLAIQTFVPVTAMRFVISTGSVPVSATIQSGGAGYSVSDVLTATSGSGIKATFTVDTVAAGVVTGITQLTEGSYTVSPTNPSATTVAPTGGTGATINITTTSLSGAATASILQTGYGT